MGQHEGERLGCGDKGVGELFAQPGAEGSGRVAGAGFGRELRVEKLLRLAKGAESIGRQRAQRSDPQDRAALALERGNQGP